MPDGKSYISTGLSSARQQLTNNIYNVIIDIGLILQTFGTRDNDSWYHHFEQEELAVGERNKEYFVFKATNADNPKVKIFQARVSDHGVNLETFQRGRWEKTLSTFAENIRIANKAWEMTNGKKEDESK